MHQSRYRGSDDGLVYGEHPREHVDVIQLSLLKSCQFTLIPELYEIFGHDKLLDFLELFAGTTIKVPSRDVLARAIRDVYVYVLLSREDNPDNVSFLAKRYEIDRDTVRQIFQEMSQICEEYGVVLKDV